jgi:hypothetical protein
MLHSFRKERCTGLQKSGFYNNRQAAIDKYYYARCRLSLTSNALGRRRATLRTTLQTGNLWLPDGIVRSRVEFYPMTL